MRLQQTDLREQLDHAIAKAAEHREAQLFWAEEMSRLVRILYVDKYGRTFGEMLPNEDVNMRVTG